MNKLKLVILSCGIKSLKLIYAIFKLFPTTDKVVFISRQSDNPSVDFMLLDRAIKKHDSITKTVILTKQLNNKFVYAFHMFTQMYHVATAKVVILDSYCMVVSLMNHKSSLKVIQIWHAIGCMKKFGYAMIGQEEGSSEEIATIMKMHKNYDYVLISSFSFINDYLEGFRIERKKILQIPLPKADLLADREYKANQRKKLEEKYQYLKNKKNILYCPTFRKNSTSEKNGIIKLLACIDFEKYNFIYKPHPLSKVIIDNNNVHLTDESTMEMLPASDYVISDYSSVIYEAGLVGIPVYLYSYDWAEYSKNRSFNLNLEEDVPTVFTTDPNKIMNAIENSDFDYKKYKSFIDKNVIIPAKGCTQSIIDLIFQQV